MKQDEGEVEHMKCRDGQRKGNNSRAHVSVGKENNLAALGGFFFPNSAFRAANPGKGVITCTIN